MLSTEELKKKFGDISLEVISHKENVRTSCIRRSSDNAVMAYNLVTFCDSGIKAFGEEFHKHIINGGAIGETIKSSGVPHERTVSEFTSSKLTFGVSFLFNTKKDRCLRRVVEYNIKDVPYAFIVEFYNPEFTLVEKDIKEVDNEKEHFFVIDELKSGYEEKYLRLAHGFLKKPMHVGIEDQDTFVKETRKTLELLMKDLHTKLFVAADDTQFIGYVALNIHPALHLNGLECVVRELYVKDEYQGNGKGTIIMAYAERYARKLSCKRMSLASRWDDEKQRGFYESLGFSRRCDFLVKPLFYDGL